MGGGNNMKNLTKTCSTICELCGCDHRITKRKTFYGAYGSYCLPLKQYKKVKAQLKNSSRFRTFLDLERLPEKKLFDEEAWSTSQLRIDSDYRNTSCRHGVSGGCFKCVPDSYCGSPGADKRDQRHE